MRTRAWAWCRLEPRLGGDARATTSCAVARGTRRATPQPDEATWNLGGYANNAVQRVAVTVVAPDG